MTPPDSSRDIADREHLSPRTFGVALAIIVLAAAALRMVYPCADPPWYSGVGIVWHDEGAWTHNARNLALFGTLRTDAWNPVFVTPVLTGLEYVCFRALGVGLWQARLVSEILGTLSVLLLGLGVARLGGRLAGVVAAGLLATNFVYVMYDRAAVIEATMVALLVVSWYCCARAERSPWWAAAAGAAAVAACFAKASAVFFIGALVLDALWSILRGGDDPRRARRAAWLTFLGLAVAGVVSLAVFVGPWWREYWFYNWQTAVVRRSSVGLHDFLDRASWLPIIHDFFSRMWIVTALALAGGLGTLLRWRRAAPAERVLLLWVGLGVAELVLHDVGNERRLVFLIPALAALAALALARDRRLAGVEAVGVGRTRALLAAPPVFGGLYVVTGAAIRLLFPANIHAGHLSEAVRWSAAAACACGVAVYTTWPRIPRFLARFRWSPVWAVAILACVLATDLWQFSGWAAIRTQKNYDAMVAVGRALPPGTLVQGKLANGLALESRIRPVFVGREHGNYADRAKRTDVRYLLTYLKPSLGYESQAANPVVIDILEASRGWKVVREFDVAQSPSGDDRAALIDKYPDRPESLPTDR